MRNFLISIILMLPLVSNAQKSKLSVSLNSGVAISNINYKDNLYIPVTHNNFLVFDEVKPQNSINSITGIDLKYFLADKISIQSGLTYLVKDLNYNQTQNFYIVTESETFINKVKYYFNSSFKYLQVPFYIQYTIGNNFQLTTSLGISASILIQKNIDFKENVAPSDLGVLPEEIELNKHILSGLIRETISYNLSHNISLNLNVNYIYDFTNLFSEHEKIYKIENDGENLYFNPIGLNADSKFRTLSISFGLEYHFN